jgi:hypothetical protein
MRKVSTRPLGASDFFRLSSGIVGFRIRLVGLLGLFYGIPGLFTGFRVILRDSRFVTGFRVILRDSRFVTGFRVILRPSRIILRDSGLFYGIPDYFMELLDWCGFGNRTDRSLQI